MKLVWYLIVAEHVKFITTTKCHAQWEFIILGFHPVLFTSTEHYKCSLAFQKMINKNECSESFEERN